MFLFENEMLSVFHLQCPKLIFDASLFAAQQTPPTFVKDW